MDYPSEPTIEELLLRLNTPESFFRAMRNMKSVNLCSVVPTEFGTKVYYMPIEEIGQILMVFLIIAVLWRLADAIGTCMAHSCKR